MRAMIIGIGQCGTKIADLFALVDFETLALNTSRSDLEYLKHIPRERRILIGESLTGGKGVNANPLLGREAMKRDEMRMLLTKHNLSPEKYKFKLFNDDYFGVRMIKVGRESFAVAEPFEGGSKSRLASVK